MEGDQPFRTFLEVAQPISIHTLRMEGDVSKEDTGTESKTISIHTLRMEGDA